MTYLTQEVFNSTNSFPWCSVFHHESWRPTSRPEFVICFQERWEVETPCDQRDDDEKGEERSLGKWERSFNIDWECFRTNDLAAPESLDSHCVHKNSRSFLSLYWLVLCIWFSSSLWRKKEYEKQKENKGIREENQRRESKWSRVGTGMTNDHPDLSQFCCTEWNNQLQLYLLHKKSNPSRVWDKHHDETRSG